MQPRGFLDKDGYEKLGRKQAPNFTGNREEVCYQDYKFHKCIIHKCFINRYAD